MSWIRTFTGQQYKLFEPDPNNVSIIDIAHQLSWLNRFCGATRTGYSVAEHCVRLSWYFYGERDISLWALLHDADEAYLGDMVSPLKERFPDYAALGEKHMHMIAHKFGLEGELPLRVRIADKRIRVDEAMALLTQPIRDDVQPLGIDMCGAGWAAVEAEARFLKRFHQLMGVTDE